MKKKDKELKEIQEIMADYDPTEETSQIVKVIWRDANTMSGTSSYTDIKERGLLQAITVGYLVDENKDRIAICGFMFPDPHTSIFDPTTITAFRDVHMIPKKWIEHILVLKIDFEETKKLTLLKDDTAKGGEK